MNLSTDRALKRFLEKTARSPRRRSGPTTAPLVLGLALLLGYQLLVRLLPMVWSATLPGGLAQARAFRGWPGLLYRLGETCYNNVLGVSWIIVGSVIVSFLLCRAAWPLRWFVWLIVVSAILLDAVVLVMILRTALMATALEAGVPL